MKVINAFVSPDPKPPNKSHFEQLLPKIYAKSFRKNNQKVCIDIFKPWSNKNKFECKNCDRTDFYMLDYQNSSFKILSSL